MTVTPGITNVAKQNWLKGVTLQGDTYKMALYTQAAATLSNATTVYTTTGELPTANGYTQGGFTMVGFTVALSTNTATLTWSTNPNWPSSTITADAYMIYDSTQSNACLCVGTFTSASSTNGTFTVNLPASPNTIMTIT